MKLFELDPRNPIDRELEKTAGNAGKNGSLDPNDIEDQEQGMDGQDGGDMGMGADMGMGGPENAPDGAMDGAAGGEPAEPPKPDAKPVDSALLARVQSHDYLQRYTHDNPDSETNPANIMGLDMTGLTDLRRRIRVRKDQFDLDGSLGASSDPALLGINTMLSFVDIIMAHKKKAAQTERTTGNNKPKVREQPQSKTPAGKQFKAKRS